MVSYEFLTQSQVDNLIEGAGAMGFAVGLLFGILIFACFYWIYRQANMKSFKMWYLQLQEDEKDEVKANFDLYEEALEKLSKSNTKLFKTYYNELYELKRYLQRKFMQS